MAGPITALPSLPNEIWLMIIQHLAPLQYTFPSHPRGFYRPSDVISHLLTPISSLLSLRHTSRLFFHNIIRPPATSEIAHLRQLVPFLWTCCQSCRRSLRSDAYASKEMRFDFPKRCEMRMAWKYCFECGCRPLPGLKRYQVGEMCVYRGREYVRCAACKEVREMGGSGKEDLCRGCWKRGM